MTTGSRVERARRRSWIGALVLACSLLLAASACSGGGSDEPEAPPPSDQWDVMRWDDGIWG